MTSNLQSRKRGNSSVLRLWEFFPRAMRNTRSYLNAGTQRKVAWQVASFKKLFAA